MFRIGQPLVCIRGTARCLRDGQTYRCTATDGDAYIRVDCCSYHQSVTIAWLASRFRPIARKTDIAIFTALLTPAGKESTNAQG